ncbi:hypothetical protein [Pseudoalteromonas sp. MMG024]|uniref:hypothetical protein n=1 Tax=Pseudoalteromonas sp. MMG024 TaxID=2909980 RepID=UPI001F279D25|nr:hypothetical protein [Pseudoalteromonas sp. MMG024]MCF6459362.1 hypothetical protein [Pseudoalteromonas sp. MMG024]
MQQVVNDTAFINHERALTLTQKKQKNVFSLTKQVGNWLMLVPVSLFMGCLLISYPFAEYFSIGQQIAAHIGTMVFPALFKIGYVIRCIGQHGLGLRV